ncbi:DUF1206 domain-containing protein [Yinghuangia soli]|uniref:DUF1206 domain-containing protein n=1 Tax=Yinghuangia soli TaxID=2908204 RepID=A0AA41Q7W7_9ACTN|nr:DUF1206 domain-containing protein [Yinghuangia soli]MCF2533230.1 DUF1206 domain-containing protein [Yinghuangia soli]
MKTSTVSPGSTAAEQPGAGGTAVRVAARFGFVARGVVYILVGALALQIAFGERDTEADRSGAVGELARQPFGGALVWALGIGLACMALWRLSEAVFGAAGPEGDKASRRLLAFVRFVFYGFVAGSVLALAAVGKGNESSDKQSKDVTADVLDLPAGRWLVGIAGLGIAIAGIWIGIRAALRKFRKRMETGKIPEHLRKAVDFVGVAGGVSRGAVFTAAGIFAVTAAKDYNPDKAKGVDDTLRSFAGTPAGPWLLVAVAAGLVLFGVFSFAMARWREL